MKGPRRLLEGEALLPPELIEALRAAPVDPRADELLKLAEKLGSSLGIALAPPAAVPVATGLASIASSNSGASALHWWAVGGVAGGVGLSIAIAFSSAVFDDPTPRSASVRPIQTPARMHAAALVHRTPAPPPAEPELGESTTEPLPPSETPFAPRAPAQEQSVALQPQESEFSLLRRAQQAVSGNPGRALALSKLHEQTFPRGLLVQEREVIVIDALLRQGKNQDARARVQRFIQRYPNSAHRQRLQGLLAGAR